MKPRKVKLPQKLDWYCLNGVESVSAILHEDRRGIYVLEFANGERYVGQAVNAAHRFAQHRRGGKHHAPWTDITAFGFMSVPEGPLATHEYAMFCQQKAEGFVLRNKTWNHDHSQPSPLDDVVPIEIQQHWATGHFPPPDVTALAASANRRPEAERPRLFTKRRGQELLPNGCPVHDAVVDNLARLILLAIPQPTETEGRFWTLSDYPLTAGGRFATLNVGRLELAYFPRKPWEILFEDGTAESTLYVMYNAEFGSFTSDFDAPAQADASHGFEVEEDNGGYVVVYANQPSRYSLPTDAVYYPLGEFDIRDVKPEGITGIRSLAVRSMRNGSAQLFRRSHSRELTRLVYQRMLELKD